MIYDELLCPDDLGEPTLGLHSAELVKLKERGGAAGAFAAEAAFSLLRGVVQRPCRGPHDVHGDGPGRTCGGVVTFMGEYECITSAQSRRETWPCAWPRTLPL